MVALKTIIHLPLFLLLVLSPLSALAGTKLDFDTVVAAALRHSYDIRISALDIGISRSQLREARSAYFPVLNARFNSQRVKDLSDAASPQVTAIGETILVENTLFQNSLSLNASYSLYDFGSRENRVLIAAKDVPFKQAILVQSVRDTKIRVLEIYRDLLVLVNDLAAKRQLLTLYKELSLTKERIYEAGLISRVEVSDEAIKVVKIVDDIDNLSLKISGALQDLSFMTGESYAAEGLEMAQLKEEQVSKPFNVSGSPEYRIYELALQKKKAELDILRKEMYLPHFGLYSNYVLYGQDPNSYPTAWGDVRARSFNVGLVASMAIFDGFKNSAQIERARLEIERLKVERDKKLSGLSSRHEKLQEETRILRKTLSNQQELMAKTEEGLSMLGRLAEQQIVEHVDLLKRRIELVTQKHEQARALILKSAAAMELRMLAEGEKGAK